MAVKVREKVKGSGEWWLFIDYKGKRKAKKFGRDKRKALDAAKQIEAKLVLGDFGLLDASEQKTATFGEYAHNWISVVVPATCKPSTESDYQGLLENHILPVLGKLQVTDIKRLTVKNFLLKKINEG